MKSPINDIIKFTRKTLAEIVDEKHIYEYLPGLGVNYPVIYIGECFSNDIRTKWGYGAKVTMRIHFYSDEYTKRGSFSELINECLQRIKETKKENGYRFSLNDSNIQIVGDNTTDKMLLHGILELDFSFL